MKHIQYAQAISLDSRARILMSEYSLPDHARALEDIAQTFDDDDRTGTWLITYTTSAKEDFAPLAVVAGKYDEVVRTAICLQPIAEVYHKVGKNLPNYVVVFRLATNFSGVNLIQPDDESPFMSFPEFVATQRENNEDVNSVWTDNEQDDEDHVKGYFYGKDHYRVLLTVCEHTDMVGLVYQDWFYSEENMIEMQALAYRCYLHTLGMITDDELKVHFPHPFRVCRVALTY